jgi:hypothetical protein
VVLLFAVEKPSQSSKHSDNITCDCSCRQHEQQAGKQHQPIARLAASKIICPPAQGINRSGT